MLSSVRSVVSDAARLALLALLCAPSAWAGEPPVAAVQRPAHPPVGGDTPLDVNDPLSRAETLPAAEFLRRFDFYLDKPAAPQPIDPELFRHFWEKWGLVTTRYKPDGEEMRFTYANKLAAETLAKGSYPFPEGSVLAKIGAKAVHDPGFSSSIMPGSIVRIQVMLKKANDPNAQDGWVYALYAPKFRGALTAAESQACHACHLMVPERDMIFSQPFPVAFGAALATLPDDQPFADKFKPMPLQALKPGVRAVLEQRSLAGATVQLLEMPTFSGTLFESREILNRLARKQRQPYVLSAPDGRQFLISLPDTDGNCVVAINTVDAKGGVTAATARDDKLPTTERRSCEKP